MSDIYTASFDPLSSLSRMLLPILLDAAAKGLIVLLLVAITAQAMRKTSAAARHLVWFLGICGLLLLPALSAALPSWHILPNLWPDETSARIQPAASASPELELKPARPMPPPAAELPTVPITTPQLTMPSDPSPAAPSPLPPPVVSHPLPVQTWILLIWLAGSGVLLAYLALSVLSLWRLGRHARPLTSPPWTTLLEDLAHQLNLRRPVHLLSSDRRTMPMTWGLWRMRLLLPHEAHDWPIEERRTVLLHELAHAKRHDCLIQLLTQLTCALYWFNPLIWLASRRMQSEREQACDDLVLACGAKPSAYAQHLLQIAASLPTPPLTAAAIAMARPSSLEGRLLAILDPRRNRKALTWTGVTAMVLLLAAVILPVAMLKAGDEPKSQPIKAPSAGALVINKGLSPIGPDLIRLERDRLLAQADAQIRKGLGDLAERYPRLEQANGWAQIKEKPAAGQASEGVAIGLYYHVDAWPKTGPVTGDAIAVTVWVHDDQPVPPSVGGRRILYPNLNLSGTVTVHGGEPELDRVLNSLVKEALAPLAELEQKAAATTRPATYPATTQSASDSRQFAEQVFRAIAEKDAGALGRLLSGDSWILSHLSREDMRGLAVGEVYTRPNALLIVSTPMPSQAGGSDPDCLNLCLVRSDQGWSVRFIEFWSARNNAVRTRHLLATYRDLQPATRPTTQAAASMVLDYQTETMQNIVFAIRQRYPIRLCFENLDFDMAKDAVTLEQALRELEAAQKERALSPNEKQRLEIARRMVKEGQPGTMAFDVGPRYTRHLEAISVEDLLDQVTRQTPYTWRRIGGSYVILPAAGTVLNFPVTLKTDGLTVSQAVQKVAEQSPEGQVTIGPTITLGPPPKPGVDPTPWRSAPAPALDLKNVPAIEALCQITEHAHPPSVWELAGYHGQRGLGLDRIPATQPASRPAATRAAAPRLQFRLIDDANTGAPADEMVDPGDRDGQRQVRVLKPILLDESAVARARRVAGNGEVQIYIDFTESGAKRFEQITSENLHRRLAIVFDGKLLSAPTIQSTIKSAAVITGGPRGLREADIDAMLAALNSANTPATHPATTQATGDAEGPRDQSIPGRLVDPAGKPVAGAQVVPCDNKLIFSVHQGDLKDMKGNGVLVISTDADGRFVIPPLSQRDMGVDPQLSTDVKRVLVYHDHGFAFFSIDELRKSGQITLQPWATVKGTFQLGSKPMAGEKIVLQFTLVGRRGSIHLDYTTTTDSAGRFEFSRVPPLAGTIGREVKASEWMTGVAPSGAIIPVPGRTTEVQLGGTGRPVIGRLVVPAGHEALSDWSGATLSLVAQVQSPALPLGHYPTTPRDFEQMDAWQQNLIESDEGRKYLLSLWSSFVAVQKDGSFRVDEVPPGRYTLVCQVNLPPSGDPPRQGRLIAYLQIIVTIPEAPAAKPDQAADLGRIEVRMTDTPASPATQSTTLPSATQPAAGTQPGASILGAWKLRMFDERQLPEILTFGSDGTLGNSLQPPAPGPARNNRYRIAGQTLEFIIDSGEDHVVQSYPFQIDGNVLTIHVDARTHTYDRLPAKTTAPATTQAATRPEKADDWIAGVWIHTRTDAPGPTEAPLRVLWLREDRTWATASVWGTPQAPEKASLESHGNRWELRPLAQPALWLKASGADIKPESQFHLTLSTGQDSSLDLGEMARKDADTIAFYSFSSILMMDEYRRAAPTERKSLEDRLSLATPRSTTHPATTQSSDGEFVEVRRVYAWDGWSHSSGRTGVGSFELGNLLERNGSAAMILHHTIREADHHVRLDDGKGNWHVGRAVSARFVTGVTEELLAFDGLSIDAPTQAAFDLRLRSTSAGTTSQPASRAALKVIGDEPEFPPFGPDWSYPVQQTFGPVVEQTIHADWRHSRAPSAIADEGAALVDLDTGKVDSFASRPELEDLGKRLRWEFRHGRDLLLHVWASPYPTASRCAIEFNNTVILRAGREDWEKLAPQQVMEDKELRDARLDTGAVNLRPEDLPVTLRFKTREGGVGLLQVVKQAADGKSVQIRYKLVQRLAQPASQPASQPPTPPAATQAMDGAATGQAPSIVGTWKLRQTPATTPPVTVTFRADGSMQWSPQTTDPTARDYKYSYRLDGDRLEARISTGREVVVQQGTFRIEGEVLILQVDGRTQTYDRLPSLPTAPPATHPAATQPPKDTAP